MIISLSLSPPENLVARRVRLSSRDSLLISILESHGVSMYERSHIKQESGSPRVCLLVSILTVYVCMFGHTYSKSMDQPSKVANPAHSQLDTGK